MSEENTIGVQKLIDRLSDEGVAEGQRQADKIITEAQHRGEGVLKNARLQANDILKEARQEAETFQKAGEEALQLAARDAVRDVGVRIHNGLRDRLQELVHQEMQKPDLIKNMILEITARARKDIGDEAVEILLPDEIVTEAETRESIESGDKDTLTKFVEGMIGESLREGVSVNLGIHGQRGVTMRVVEENIEIDLTEDAITELLARHLLPRFRAVMRSES